MPILRSKYKYTKVYRPTGTRVAHGRANLSPIREVKGEDRQVVSITKVCSTATSAIGDALSNYLMEFHPLTGIPPETVINNKLLIELLVDQSGVSAVAIVVPDEDEQDR